MLYTNFADFWPCLAIFTLFGAFSLCTVGAFWPFLRYFLGFVGIFWGPRELFRRFWGNFDHFS